MKAATSSFGASSPKRKHLRFELTNSIVMMCFIQKPDELADWFINSHFTFAVRQFDCSNIIRMLSNIKCIFVSDDPISELI